jgi:hypothetical protein
MDEDVIMGEEYTIAEEESYFVPSHLTELIKYEHLLPHHFGLHQQHGAPHLTGGMQWICPEKHVACPGLWHAELCPLQQRKLCCHYVVHLG